MKGWEEEEIYIYIYFHIQACTTIRSFPSTSPVRAHFTYQLDIAAEYLKQYYLPSKGSLYLPTRLSS